MRADKAYDSRANRSYLRRRGIKATISVPADRIRNRLNRGSRGGRPPTFDKGDYKQRHTGVRINRLKRHRCRHSVRQTRPLRSNRAGRSHQRVALTSTFTTDPSPWARYFVAPLMKPL
ncbi:hypothetical protein GCM10010398_22410 [Streptomyces fimbriatus]